MVYSVEKVDVNREQFCTSVLENFRASSKMRHFWMANFLIKRAYRAPKTLCSLLHEVFSKIVIICLTY